MESAEDSAIEWWMELRLERQLASSTICLVRVRWDLFSKDWLWQNYRLMSETDCRSLANSYCRTVLEVMVEWVIGWRNWDTAEMVAGRKSWWSFERSSRALRCRE